MQRIAPEVTSTATPVRVRWEVSGAVQGVGFRPWIYRLAVAEGLAGWVANTSAGVAMELEGPPQALERFARALSAPPPMARVLQMHRREVAAEGATTFAIRPSAHAAEATAEVAPDAAPCLDCLADLAQPGGRRFKYPFTNCTTCGPRYSITRALPYDRPQTTMASFRQCADCQAEYDSPADRRFHAQPNACPACGPAVSMPPEEVARHLRAGSIVALKSVGGYQLLCDAANPAAVERLRAGKRRGRKPFALLARDRAAVAAVCRLDAREWQCLAARTRPILLLDRRPGGVALPEAVAPGQCRLGLLLSPSPLHELVFAAGAPALLVATSGNRSDLPLAADEAEAEAQLAGLADAFCHHNRPVQARCDDSVAFVWRGRERLVRRARGYAPAPVAFGGADPPVWAAGGEMKNTFCITRGGEAFLSPHLGDMDAVETQRLAGETLNHYLSLLEARPEILAYDPHPGYAVSRWARDEARRRGLLRSVPVQHHHAHIAAVMAEHGLDGELWGVAWDGTGWGDDATVWGGEFLLARRDGYERRAWLRPLGLVGGDRAVREPWRLGLAWLWDALGEGARTRAQQLWPQLPAGRAAQLAALLARPRWALPCSSAGRYFDAAAVLMGAVEATATMTFEGEAALAVENAAGDEPLPADPYPFGQDGAACDLRPTLCALLDDRCAGIGIPTMAARFHATLAAVIVATAERLRAAAGGRRVCLGGGVFQNRRLLTLAADGLEAAGFEVFVPERVPANDGGLALGQAAVAAARCRAG